jgi:hypothetical protein
MPWKTTGTGFESVQDRFFSNPVYGCEIKRDLKDGFFRLTIWMQKFLQPIPDFLRVG